MKSYDKSSAKNHIIGMVRQNDVTEFETDLDGQLVLHTGIFLWKDGTLHDEPQEVKE